MARGLPVALQLLERPAHRDHADAGQLRELVLARELVARTEVALDDELLDPVGRPLEERPAARARPGVARPRRMRRARLRPGRPPPDER